jgi:hypothetical protein
MKILSSRRWSGAMAGLVVAALVPAGAGSASAASDGRLSGRVRDRAGHAVAGAAVRLTDGAGVTAGQDTSDDSGRYSVAVAAGTRVVVQDLQLMTDHLQDLTLPFTDVSVDVRDDEGAPVAGARAYLHGDCDCLDDGFPWADTSATWSYAALTDVDGNAVVRAFPGKAVLDTEPPPGRPALQHTTQPVTVPAAGTVRVLMPRRGPQPPPPPVSTLRGRLLDRSGQAFDADLWLEADGHPVGHASFADDGSFTVAAPPGRYDLRIEAVTDTYLRGFDSGDDGIPGLTIVLPGFDLTGDRTQDLRLPIVDFPVSVLDPIGRPLGDVRVTGDSHGTVELFPGGRGTGTLLNNPGTDESGTAHLMTFEGAAPPVVEAGLYDVIGRTTLRPGATSAVIRADAPVVRGSVRDRRGLLPEPVRRGAWVSFHRGSLGKFAPWPFDIGPDSTYTLQARRGWTKLHASNEPVHSDDGGAAGRGPATLPTFWTFSAVYTTPGTPASI